MPGFWPSKPTVWLKFDPKLGPNMNFNYSRESLKGAKQTFWGYYTFSTPCINKVLKVHWSLCLRLHLLCWLESLGFSLYLYSFRFETKSKQLLSQWKWISHHSTPLFYQNIHVEDIFSAHILPCCNIKWHSRNFLQKTSLFCSVAVKYKGQLLTCHID